MFTWIERHTPTAIHFECHVPVIRKALNGPKLTLAIFRSLAGAVNWMRSPTENTFSWSRRKEKALLPAWVVGQLRTIGPHDGELIRSGIDALHAGILALLQASLFGIP